MVNARVLPYPLIVQVADSESSSQFAHSSGLPLSVSSLFNCQMTDSTPKTQALDFCHHGGKGVCARVEERPHEQRKDLCGLVNLKVCHLK